MTEQTVPVPLHLLKEVADGSTLVADYLEGISGTLSGSAALALQSIVNLIPNPPKVGDTVEYERRLDLPFGTVVADKDGDLWVHLETGYAYINITSHEQVEEEPGVGRAPASYYGPFTIVYLRD